MRAFSIQIEVMTDGDAPDVEQMVKDLEAEKAEVHRAVVVEHSGHTPMQVVDILAALRAARAALKPPPAPKAAPAPAPTAPAPKASGGPGGFGDL